MGVVCLLLSGCGGGGGSAGSSSTTGSGSGSGSSTSPNLSINVSGLSSGQSVSVEAQSDNSSSITASSNGVFGFPQQINDAGTNGVTNQITVTFSSQPTNETCVVEPPATGITLNSTVPVACSVPVNAPTYPTIGGFSGGSVSVIAQPKVLPVFLTSAPSENTDLVFLQQLVVSHYWSALAEYGVDSGTVESALYESAPTTLSTGPVSDSMIKAALTANGPSWGATLDPSTVMVVFLPAGTSYSPDFLQGEPDNAPADHGQVTINGNTIQFVAIPAQANHPYYIAEYLIDAVTNPGGGGTSMASSNGFVEMSSDPERYALTGYLDTYGAAGAAVARPYQEYVELGDACFGLAAPESDITLPSSSTGLNEIWSNSGAASAYSAGNYGYCRPSFGENVDYSSSSDESTVSASRFGHTFTDKALVVPAGSSTTVTVTAWGTNTNNGVSSPWTLTVNPEVFYTSGNAVPSECFSGMPDFNPAYAPAACTNAPSVSVTPNGSASVVNGDTFKVTITMPSTAEPGLWSILLSGTDGGTEQPILVTNASTWQ